MSLASGASFPDPRPGVFAFGPRWGLSGSAPRRRHRLAFSRPPKCPVPPNPGYATNGLAQTRRCGSRDVSGMTGVCGRVTSGASPVAESVHGVLNTFAQQFHVQFLKSNFSICEISNSVWMRMRPVNFPMLTRRQRQCLDGWT